MSKSPKELIQTLTDANYSQELIAKKTGVSQATISRLASGEQESTSYIIYLSLLNLVNTIAS